MCYVLNVILKIFLNCYVNYTFHVLNKILQILFVINRNRFARLARKDQRDQRILKWSFETSKSQPKLPTKKYLIY